MRHILDFSELACTHKKDKTDALLNYDNLHEPLVQIPLWQVVPFFLHGFLGLFQKSIDALRREMRKIDRTIPIHLRNPEDLEQLGKELEKALVDKETAEANRREAQTFVELLSETYEEVNSELAAIYKNWRWKNAEQTVFNKPELSEVQRARFVELLPQGPKLAADVESLRKILSGREKHSNSCSQLVDKISNHNAESVRFFGKNGKLYHTVRTRNDWVHLVGELCRA